MTILNPKLQVMRFHILFLFAILFWACPGPTGETDLNTITNQQFTFHQDINQLYYGVTVEETYTLENLSKVSINWYGTSRSNSPDTLTLYDDGTNGDILMGDGLHGLKIVNDSTNITNILGDDSGHVYMDFVATYKTETVTVSDSFRIGNIIPRFLSISFPDSMPHPTEPNYYAIDSIFVSVFDPYGLKDIRSCYLMLKKPDGSFANNGQPIYLKDDGVKSSENISIWDSKANDGIFTRLITIGYENPLGKYYGIFYLYDWGGLSSTHMDSVVVYE